MRKLRPEDFGITRYTEKLDGSFDVFDDVKLKEYKHLITNGELPLKFGTVHGDFNCSLLELTTLKNSPKIVKGDFHCANNKLTSLEYCPLEVHGEVYCSHNQIKNFNHFNSLIKGGLYARDNEFTSFEGFNANVSKSIDVRHNKISSLKGSPRKILESFDCSYNLLTSLEHCPEEIMESFRCENNKIENLLFFPKKIGWVISLSSNNLKTLEGMLPIVKGRFYCNENYNLTDLGSTLVEIDNVFEILNTKIIKIPETLKIDRIYCEEGVKYLSPREFNDRVVNKVKQQILTKILSLKY